MIRIVFEKVIFQQGVEKIGWGEWKQLNTTALDIKAKYRIGYFEIQIEHYKILYKSERYVYRNS